MGFQKVRKYICAKCKRNIDVKQGDVDGADFVVEQTPDAEIYWHTFCKQVTQ